MDGARAAYHGERAGYGDVSLRKVLIISVIFHLIVLVGLPLMGKLFVKPKKFERPATFQLVQMPPTPPPPQRKVPTPPAPSEPPPPDPTPPPPTPPPTPAPTPTPKPPTPKPTPTPPETTPQPPKPTPKEERVSKPVEENTDDLMALLSEIPLPQAQISAPGTPSHPYLNGVRARIEKNLERISYNSKIAVVVSFEIYSDGSVQNIRITSSSGDATVDNWGKNAVIRAVPFGKLPWPDKNMIEIDITLRPTRKN